MKVLFNLAAVALTATAVYSYSFVPYSTFERRPITLHLKGSSYLESLAKDPEPIANGFQQVNGATAVPVEPQKSSPTPAADADAFAEQYKAYGYQQKAFPQQQQQTSTPMSRGPPPAASMQPPIRQQAPPPPPNKPLQQGNRFVLPPPNSQQVPPPMNQQPPPMMNQPPPGFPNNAYPTNAWRPQGNAPPSNGVVVLPPNTVAMPSVNPVAPPPLPAPPAAAATQSPSIVAEVVQGLAFDRRLAEVEKGREDLGKLVAGAALAFGLPLSFLLGSMNNDGNSNSPTVVPPPPLPVQNQVAPTPVAPMVPNVNRMATATNPPDGVYVMSQPITRAEVRSLFNLWNNALKTGDPSKVADRYSRDGTLLPTLSDTLRYDYNGIRDYFVGFLKKQPVGRILEGEIMIGNNWAQDAGIYQFTFGKDGSSVLGRYSFVYVYEDGEWKIAHHHSSQLPGDTVRKVSITESEVRGLFKLWNDALETGNPKEIVKRYTADAVLLPTVSDTPRYTPELIEDYFVGFMATKPRGAITEGKVKIGSDWAQDAGIYEFTYQDGSKTRARYSFVYTYVDGEWKIAHQHSSIMPEPAVKALRQVAAMS